MNKMVKIKNSTPLAIAADKIFSVGYEKFENSAGKTLWRVVIQTVAECKTGTVKFSEHYKTELEAAARFEQLIVDLGS